MRECVLNDADLYKGPNDCYIHVEKAGDGPFRIVVAGDEVQLVYGLLGILRKLEDNYGAPVKNWLNVLSQMDQNRKPKGSFLSKHFGKKAS